MSIWHHHHRHRRDESGDITDDEPVPHWLRPLQPEAPLTGGRWRDRWANNLSFRIGWSAVFSGLVGIPMGLVYFLLSWVFRDSSEVLRSLGEEGFDVGGGLYPYGAYALLVLASLLGGGFAPWVAARLLGSRGWSLWIPVMAFAAAAVGVGLGLSVTLIAPVPQVFVPILVSGTVLLLVAATRMHHR